MPPSTSSTRPPAIPSTSTQIPGLPPDPPNPPPGQLRHPGASTRSDPNASNSLQNDGTRGNGVENEGGNGSERGGRKRSSESQNDENSTATYTTNSGSGGGSVTNTSGSSHAQVATCLEDLLHTGRTMSSSGGSTTGRRSHDQADTSGRGASDWAGTNGEAHDPQQQQREGGSHQQSLQRRSSWATQDSAHVFSMNYPPEIPSNESFDSQARHQQHQNNPQGDGGDGGNQCFDDRMETQDGFQLGQSLGLNLRYSLSESQFASSAYGQSQHQHHTGGGRTGLSQSISVPAFGGDEADDMIRNHPILDERLLSRSPDRLVGGKEKSKDKDGGERDTAPISSSSKRPFLPPEPSPNFAHPILDREKIAKSSDDDGLREGDGKDQAEARMEGNGLEQNAKEGTNQDQQSLANGNAEGNDKIEEESSVESDGGTRGKGRRKEPVRTKGAARGAKGKSKTDSESERDGKEVGAGKGGGKKRKRTPNLENRQLLSKLTSFSPQSRQKQEYTPFSSSAANQLQHTHLHLNLESHPQSEEANLPTLPPSASMSYSRPPSRPPSRPKSREERAAARAEMLETLISPVEVPIRPRSTPVDQETIEREEKKGLERSHSEGNLSFLTSGDGKRPRSNMGILDSLVQVSVGGDESDGDKTLQADHFTYNSASASGTVTGVTRQNSTNASTLPQRAPPVPFTAMSGFVSVPSGASRSDSGSGPRRDKKVQFETAVEDIAEEREEEERGDDVERAKSGTAFATAPSRVPSSPDTDGVSGTPAKGSGSYARALFKQTPSSVGSVRQRDFAIQADSAQGSPDGVASPGMIDFRYSLDETQSQNQQTQSQNNGFIFPPLPTYPDDSQSLDMVALSSSPPTASSEKRSIGYTRLNDIKLRDSEEDNNKMKKDPWAVKTSEERRREEEETREQERNQVGRLTSPRRPAGERKPWTFGGSSSREESSLGLGKDTSESGFFQSRGAPVVADDDDDDDEELEPTQAPTKTQEESQSQSQPQPRFLPGQNTHFPSSPTTQSQSQYEPTQIEPTQILEPTQLEPTQLEPTQPPTQEFYIPQTDYSGNSSAFQMPPPPVPTKNQKTSNNSQSQGSSSNPKTQTQSSDGSSQIEATQVDDEAASAPAGSGSESVSRFSGLGTIGFGGRGRGRGGFPVNRGGGIHDIAARFKQQGFPQAGGARQFLPLSSGSTSPEQTRNFQNRPRPPVLLREVPSYPSEASVSGPNTSYPNSNPQSGATSPNQTRGLLPNTNLNTIAETPSSESLEMREQQPAVTRPAKRKLADREEQEMEGIESHLVEASPPTTIRPTRHQPASNSKGKRREPFSTISLSSPSAPRSNQNQPPPSSYSDRGGDLTSEAPESQGQLPLSAGYGMELSSLSAEPSSDAGRSGNNQLLTALKTAKKANANPVPPSIGAPGATTRSSMGKATPLEPNYSTSTLSSVPSSSSDPLTLKAPSRGTRVTKPNPKQPLVTKGKGKRKADAIEDGDEHASVAQPTPSTRKKSKTTTGTSLRGTARGRKKTPAARATVERRTTRRQAALQAASEPEEKGPPPQQENKAHYLSPSASDRSETDDEVDVPMTDQSEDGAGERLDQVVPESQEDEDAMRDLAWKRQLALEDEGEDEAGDDTVIAHHPHDGGDGEGSAADPMVSSYHDKPCSPPISSRHHKRARSPSPDPFVPSCARRPDPPFTRVLAWIPDWTVFASATLLSIEINSQNLCEYSAKVQFDRGDLWGRLLEDEAAQGEDSQETKLTEIPNADERWETRVPFKHLRRCAVRKGDRLSLSRTENLESQHIVDQLVESVEDTGTNMDNLPPETILRTTGRTLSGASGPGKHQLSKVLLVDPHITESQFSANDTNIGFQNRKLSDQDIESLKRSTLGPRFHGMAFVLTFPTVNGDGAGVTKESATQLILHGGGRVIEDFTEIVKFNPDNGECEWITDSSEDTEDSRDTPAPEAPKKGKKVTKKGKGRRKGVETKESEAVEQRRRLATTEILLVTNSASTSPKYLMALALGIPCVSALWLTFEDHRPWSSFCLPAGHSLFLGGPAFGSQPKILSRLQPHTIQTFRQHREQHMLFREKTFLCRLLEPKPKGRGTKGKGKAAVEIDSKGPATTFSTLLLAMGASFVECCDFESINTPSGKTEFDFDYIIIKDDAKTRPGARTRKGGGGERNGTRTTSHGSLSNMISASATGSGNGTENGGVSFCDLEWIKQCLIFGEVLEPRRWAV